MGCVWHRCCCAAVPLMMHTPSDHLRQYHVMRRAPSLQQHRIRQLRIAARQRGQGQKIVNRRPLLGLEHEDDALLRRGRVHQLTHAVARLEHLAPPLKVPPEAIAHSLPPPHSASSPHAPSRPVDLQALERAQHALHVHSPAAHARARGSAMKSRPTRRA